MALIKCDECGNSISDKAKICPHCGYERKSNTEDHNMSSSQTEIDRKAKEKRYIMER